MLTRIRELRKKHGLTQVELAQKIGTTAQTVQRLETANMTVSTDWLEKFAKVFDVRPADLLQREEEGRITFLGPIGMQSLAPVTQTAPTYLDLSIPAQNPVAVRLEERIGPYDKRTILIGEKLQGEDRQKGQERDCIIITEDQKISVGRVIIQPNGKTNLIPHEQTTKPIYDIDPPWIAPIVMTVKYI